MVNQFHVKLFHIEACGDDEVHHLRAPFAKLPKLFVIEAGKRFGITLPKRPTNRYQSELAELGVNASMRSNHHLLKLHMAVNVNST